jgi:hypothetical protein
MIRAHRERRHHAETPPNCSAMLREDRLQRHVKKVHAQRALAHRRPFLIGTMSGKCAVCGFNAVPGDNLCYTHVKQLACNNRRLYA